jgi:hypothetical protein
LEKGNRLSSKTIYTPYSITEKVSIEIVAGKTINAVTEEGAQ